MEAEGVMQVTVAIIKPDAVRRRLVGHIVSRIERVDISISHLRQISPVTWPIRRFYGRQHWDKPYFEELVDFMNSGESVGMILTGVDVIKRWRGLMGTFSPKVPGTLRGDLMMPECRPMENLVHGSDSIESAGFELDALREHL